MTQCRHMVSMKKLGLEGGNEKEKNKRVSYISRGAIWWFLRLTETN